MPLGVFRQSLNLANLVDAPPADPRIFRGYVRSASTSTVNAFNVNNLALSTAFTHGCGIVHIIRTMKLPNSNNQIIAVGGQSGRRVLHWNATTAVFTSIFASTAITNITTCDITFNSVNDKFYVAWGSSTGTTANRVRLSTGTLSSPTNAMSETGLADPGQAVYSCNWTPDGNTLAVRGATNIRTYYRASGDVMTQNATSYSLSGGLSGNSYEDLSWNASGTVLATGRDSRIITRYSLESNGALTSLGDSTIATSASADRAIPSFNPNPSFANVMAVGMGNINGVDDGFTLAYFASGGGGTLNTLPGATGFVTFTTGNARQVRWSPTGDRLVMLVSIASARSYSFTYSEGSTALVATNSGAVNTIALSNNDYSFDWIYY